MTLDQYRRISHQPGCGDQGFSKRNEIVFIQIGRRKNEKNYIIGYFGYGMHVDRGIHRAWL